MSKLKQKVYDLVTVTDTAKNLPLEKDKYTVRGKDCVIEMQRNASNASNVFSKCTLDISVIIINCYKYE